MFFIPLLHPNTDSCCFLMKVSKVKDFNLGCQSKIMEELEGLTLLLFYVLTRAVMGVCFSRGEEGRTRARIISNQALSRTNITRE